VKEIISILLFEKNVYNFLMLDIIKKIFNRYEYIILFLVLIVVNIFVLDNGILGDDFHFIFSPGSSIQQTENPFFYFFPWSKYFKSWAVSYFSIWIMFKCWAQNFVYYRFINILFHFFNFIILRKILNQKNSLNKFNNKIISYFFLFTPLSILTYSWIFQIKTLLAVFFILLFLLKLWDKKEKFTRDYLILSILFLLSILSKSVAILMPIYVFLFFFKDLRNRKKIIFISSLFLISTFYGLLNIKGITAFQKEVEVLTKVSLSKNEAKQIEKIEILSSFQKEYQKKEDINLNIKIYKEVKFGVENYFSQITNTSLLVRKHVISIQNMGRLILSSLGLNNYYPFYEDANSFLNKDLILIYIVIAHLFIFFVIVKKDLTGILLILIFLPISGYFYIPYMKFSYASDHWFYPPCAFLILFFAKHVKNTKTIIFFFAIILGSYSFTIYKYRDMSSLLIGNYLSNGNKFSIENKTSIDLLKKNSKTILNDYNLLLEEKDPDNFIYFDTFTHHNMILGNSYENKFISRFAKLTLNNYRVFEYNKFLIQNQQYLNERDLVLLRSLKSIRTLNMSNDDYTAALELLK